MYDSQNVFAKILRGEIPSSPIYENEFAYAFKNIYPKAAVHVLVIPRGEYINIRDFTENASVAEQAGFWNAVFETANILGLNGDFRISANSGAYQSVMHFHVHLRHDESFKHDL